MQIPHDIYVFCEQFGKKYDVDFNDILYQWCLWTAQATASQNNVKYSSPPTCSYIFIKGKYEGTFCNIKTKGTKYCKRHSRYEKKGQELNMTKPARIRGNIIK